MSQDADATDRAENLGRPDLAGRSERQLRVAEPALGRLEAVDPRSIWANEERDFTPWLLAHSDYLAEALGIDLGLDALEHPVGPFELDLLGRNLSDGTVLIVENQLEPTNHDHLGKLLTYAAGTDATTLVWIATRFNEQHRQAITWLNERTDEETSFFAVEIGLVRIGGSPPAPNFKIVAAPNEWQKRARDASRARRAASGRGAAYADFWSKLVERIARERPGWTQRRTLTGNVSNWLDMPCQYVPNGWFSMAFPAGQRLRHGIYIGGGSGEENLSTFEGLRLVRSSLERGYGSPLEFEPREGRKACSVSDYTQGDVMRVEEHDKYIEWFIQTGDRLRRALEAVPPIRAAVSTEDGDNGFFR